MINQPPPEDEFLDPLPRADDNSVLQQASFTAIQYALPAERFIFRPGQGQDYGVDCSLELRRGGLATNRLAQVQVKATDQTETLNDGSVSHSIEVSNLNYLLNSGLSALYFLYVRPRDEIRYVWAHDEVARIAALIPEWQTRVTVTLKFVKRLSESESLNEIFNRVLREGMALRKFREVPIPASAGSVNSALIIGATATIVVGSPSTEDTGSASPRPEQEVGIEALIQSARGLLRGGQSASARGILAGIDDRAVDRISKDLRLQLALARTASFWDSDLDAAARYAQQAYDCDHNAPKAIANMGLMRLLQGRYDEAYDLSRQAMALDIRVDNGASVYIQACAETGRLVEAEAFAADAEWTRKDPFCMLALGQSYLRQSRFDEAESHSRIAIALGGSNEGLANFVLAESILAAIEADELLTSSPLWVTNEQVSGKLQEAKSALTNAVALATAREQWRFRLMALGTRAGLEYSLGQFEEALADCDAVIHSASDLKAEVPASLDIVYTTKGNLLSRENRVLEATICFESVIGVEQRLHIIPLLAAAYLDTGRVEDVIELIKPLWEYAETHNRSQLQNARFLLKAYDETGDTNEATTILENLLLRFPDDPEAFLIRADHASRMGRRDEVLSLLQAADVATSSAAGNESLHLVLAQWYSSLKMYRDAASHYGKALGEPTNLALVNPVATENYAICLFNSGDYGASLNIVRRARLAKVSTLKLMEIEGRLLEMIGDREAAIKLRRQLVIQEPKRAAHHRVRLAALLFEGGEGEAARREIERTTALEIRDDAISLIVAAQLRGHLGLTGVIPLAYLARRAAFGEPEMHEAYVDLFNKFNWQESERLSPDLVVPGCTVDTQRDDGSKTTYTIEQDVEPDGGRNEIAPSDPLALRLLGLGDGARAVIREYADGGETSLTISNIRSKYVFALNQALQEYPDRFPQNRAIERYEASERGFQQLSARLESSRKQRLTAIKTYLGFGLSLGMLSRRLGESIFDTWSRAIRPQSGLPIHCSRGTLETIQAEHNLAQVARSFVFDTVALLTLGVLEVGDDIADAYEGILVAQTTLDTFTGWYRNELNAQPRMLQESDDLAEHREPDYLGDRPRSITQADIDQRRNLLQRIISFVRNRAVLCSVSSLAEYSAPKNRNMADHLSRGTVAAILLAKERSLPLVSDDVALNEIALAHWEVTNTPVRPVLEEARRRGILTSARYYAAVEKLIHLNYEFIPVDADFLYWLLYRDGMEIAESFSRALHLLDRPNTNPAAPISIRVELLHRLFWLPFQSDDRLSVADYLVKSLIQVWGIDAFNWLKAELWRTRHPNRDPRLQPGGPDGHPVRSSLFGNFLPGLFLRMEAVAANAVQTDKPEPVDPGALRGRFAQKRRKLSEKLKR